MSYDIVVITISVMAMIYGFIRGFFRQLLSLLGLLVAVYYSLFHYQKAASFLSPYIKGRGILILASIALTFIVVYTIFAVVSFVISMMVKGMVGFLDRFFGALFALFKVFILLSVVTLFLSSFDSTRGWVFSSKTGPSLYSTGVYLAGYVEKAWRKKWNLEPNSRK